MTELMVGAAGALIAAVLWDELKAWAPTLSRGITRGALHFVPNALRDRLAEEWCAHVDDTPGHLGKIGVALGFVVAATMISRDARRAAATLSGKPPVSLRAMDVTFSAAALLAIAPVMLIVAVLVKVDSRGPVIFAQPRLGRGGRIIHVYKYRTLNPAGAPTRVSRAGRILRRSSLDELPQLINVLRGDMSLVGPRPELASADPAETPRPGILHPQYVGISGPLNARKYLRALLTGIFTTLLGRTL